jgi:glycosyltransferase involved in cell wall biosynthesis
MPRISVLLPVRDAAPFMEACLASLAAQTLADHEVVAVDDGSTDGTLALLQQSGDARVRVVPARGRGLVAALNAGLAAARGPLLARMDADDVAHPERLAIQAARLTHDAAVDILGTRIRLTGRTPRGNAGMRRYVEWSNGLLDHDAIASDMLVESPIVHPTVAMRTETLRRLGGYRDVNGPEDYELWLRARRAGLRFAKTPEVLLEWRDRPERLTRTDPRYLPERFQDLKIEALLAGPLLAPDRPVVVWGAGPVGKGWARALISRGRRIAAFIEIDPRKLGQVIGGVPVVAVPSARHFASALHLAAVGNREARGRIRGVAAELGLADGRDLVAVA